MEKQKKFDKPKQGKLFAGASRGFDPITITAQIAALWFTYASGLLLWTILCDWSAGLRPHTA